MSLMVSNGPAEPKALTDLVKYEVNPSFTRASGVFLAGAGAAVAIALGTVIASDGSLSVASAAGGGNTGQGVLSGVALAASPQAGVYTLECVTAATGAAVFSVIDPKGDRLKDAVEAVAYDNGQIAFTIGTDSPTTEFVAGDSFTITVTEGAGKLGPLDLTATDGAQIVAGVALADIIVPDGADGAGLILERGPAIVLRDSLVYPDGASAGQKAAIDASLEAKGILVRDAV
jgi:hypothetical protein